MRNLQIAVVVLLAAGTVGCGTSRVYREGSSSRPSPRVSVPVPKYGKTIVVQPGDTLFRIASAHGVSTLDLAMWNNIAPPYVIYPGQRLRMVSRDGKAPAVSSTPPLRPPTVTQPKPAPVVATPPASPVAWRWPADGELIGRFAAGEPTRQGVDIAGSSGAPVRAAGDGVVVYSGSGLVGYGELVIIKHTDAWLSAYGHNRTRLVNEGQLVKAGQQIAEMGHTGAARDMLHFEIRYNGKPVDPLGYLPKR